MTLYSLDMTVHRRQVLGMAAACALTAPAFAKSATVLPAMAGLRLPVMQTASTPRTNTTWANASTLGTDDFRGHWVYLDFWASWCGPCRQSFPWMNTLQERFAPRGLHIVAVGLDKKADQLDAFLKSTLPRFWILWDAHAAWAEKLQIQGMPTSTLIRPDGEIVGWHRGFTQQTAQQVETQLNQWLPEHSR